MKKVMVLRSGFMGSGIAQVCAAGGLEVLLWDMSEALVQKSISKIAAGLEARVAKGKETEERKNEILSHLIPCTDLKAAADAELIIEVIIEEEAAKHKILAEVEGYAQETAFLGTNTSRSPSWAAS